ncbi:glycoside hydrolase family 2 protein [Sphingomonas sp. R-74633]|uniref:beta-mannosidase n=1 Tax=Sphingomonas sp. R-74633 TaxID=2751188 RepID=UPI0015D1AE36|nr:glycoside hydrolase family 2 protein [Sphingomonas sp. R-74633]NYT40314.1 glycoside hydrolase family 2 protein [Sphingomonas sp. R-74633]
MSTFVSAWRIRDFAPGEGASAGAAAGQGEGWIPASASGDTYRALIDAGRLADPYVGRNEAEAAWVRDREWWWHTNVEIGPDAELVFEGLDTFADIYLDGTLLGSADNMFRSWRFDAPAGAHDLAICFHPTMLKVAGGPLPVFPGFADRISHSRRTLMRKAQFGWGWDWGPDLPTVGIWKPVRIEPRTPTLRSLNFATRAIGTSAEVTIDLDLSAPAEVAVKLLDPKGKVVAEGARHGSGQLELRVPDPQLWWTADLGAQPLYTLVANIGGKTVHYRTGIRTLELDQSPDPDEPGTIFFRFVLNGIPLFAKGANWVPASSFVGAIPDRSYTDLLERAVGANFNMIRVWGGGVYEHDIFYDECNRLGLLVWQDFMFACAPYPDDNPDFVDNIRAEVAEQVARLRHHACLALWCGNNENQAIQFFADHATSTVTPLAGQFLYDELIPGILADLDPKTPYWPGSPWGGPSPNSMRGGDVHNWTVWHGIPLVPDKDAVGVSDSSPKGVAFTRYAEDFARFVSEFGIQAAPDIGTLKRWMAPEDLKLGSAGFLERIKDVADKASAMMIPVTGLPETLQDYVAFTMLTQAEGMKFAIEHYRRRKPHCSGALIWQHNDCWPCVSWSLIDYDGVAKSSWYATRRAFAPVLASFRIDGDSAELWVTNDTLAPVRDTATIALARLAGGTEWEEQVPLDVAPNSSICVWPGPVALSAEHVLTVRSAGGTFPANRALLAPVKDLALAPDPGLEVTHEQVGEGLALTLTAERYALAVHLRSDDPALRFEDNHFDLAGGEQRTILVTHSGGGEVRREAIEVSSW